MKTSKRKRLEIAGWRVGSAEEFLELTAEEAMLVEMRLTLATNLRQRRQELEMTQAELAGRLGSSQSRVAKMEAADASVSLDLLVRGLAVLGVSRRELGGMVGATAIGE